MEIRGWTAYELAKRAEVRPSTVMNILREQSEPTLATLRSICLAFRITPAQFFEEKGNDDQVSDEQELLMLYRTIEKADKNLLKETAKRFGSSRLRNNNGEDGESP